MTYSGVSLDRLGSFNLCWCVDTCADSTAFATAVGSLVVQGPDSSLSFTAVINRAEDIVLPGTSLATDNRIVIVGELDTCGQASNSADAVQQLPGRRWLFRVPRSR